MFIRLFVFLIENVFQDTGSTIQPNYSTVIVGVVAIVATFGSTLVVDKLGRKILLLYSVVAMGFCTFFIGGYFYGEEYNYDVSDLSFVPLVALCIFVIMFNAGFGPIPWMLVSEIFPPQIKSKLLFGNIYLLLYY